MELVQFENYSNEFYWDKKMHFPIPTNKYILERTGIDLGDRYDTDEEAKGFVIGVSRTAKNYAFRYKDKKDSMNTEYYIAHNLEVIYETLEYICEFIKIALVGGEYDRLFMMTNKNQTIIGLENAYNQLSYVYKIVLDGVSYYEGY